MKTTRKITKLGDVYAKLPVLICKGLCSDSCGVIPLSRSERDAIAEYTDRRVKTAPGGIIEAHSKHLVMRTGDDLTCVYLKKGRCSIYEVRPMICRLYGLSVGLKCPFGCIPSRWITDEEAHLLIEETGSAK